MQVVGRGDERVGWPGSGPMAPAALWRDVVDEVARAVGAVADEGAAGRELGVDGDGGDVDAVAGEAVEC